MEERRAETGRAGDRLDDQSGDEAGDEAGDRVDVGGRAEGQADDRAGAPTRGRAGEGAEGQAGEGTVVVDGNNVIGAVADGWWRDRPAAVRRLLGRLRCYRQSSGHTVVLVLDVPQADLPAGHHDGVEVRYARRRGRNAADDRILELLDERDLAGAEVVSSDRALAAGAIARHARVTGAGTFLAHLARSGC